MEEAPQRIDLNSGEFTEMFVGAPTYRKTVTVRAWPAKPGQLVDTVLADGTRETRSHVAEAGDMIVHNFKGEEYVVSQEDFAKRYKETDSPGLYRSTGVCRILTNTTGHDVVINAPWGNEQFGEPNCVFAAEVDENGFPTDDRYIIGRSEFNLTYRSEPALLLQQQQTQAAMPQTPQLIESGSAGMGL